MGKKEALAEFFCYILYDFTFMMFGTFCELIYNVPKNAHLPL